MTLTLQKSYRIYFVAMIWLLCGSIASLLCNVMENTYIYYAAKNGRTMAPLVSIAVRAASFLGFLTSIRMAFKLFKIDWYKTIAVAIVLSLSAKFLNPPPYKTFLDGFAARAAETVNQPEALSWADEMFKTATKDGISNISVIDASKESVPTSIRKLFNYAPTRTTVSFSNQANPAVIHVYVGGGLAKWGIAVFKEGTTVSISTADYVKCGDRFFVFHSNR